MMIEVSMQQMMRTCTAGGSEDLQCHLHVVIPLPPSSLPYQAVPWLHQTSNFEAACVFNYILH